MENKEPKKNRFFKLTHYNLERANTSHALILVLVGAYLIYMVYFIVKNYINGETSMKLVTTVIVTVVMVAVSVGIFIYAGVVFYISRNAEEIGREQDEEFGYVHEEEEEAEEESKSSEEETSDALATIPGFEEDTEDAGQGETEGDSATENGEKLPWIYREWNRDNKKKKE